MMLTANHDKAFQYPVEKSRIFISLSETTGQKQAYNTMAQNPSAEKSTPLR